ncbi:MAG TPA: hypothetical protein VF682_19300 [Pseudomonas sp.]|jgi:hypothetical protein
MEMWGLVKRLLAGAAGGGQTFMPRLIGITYYSDLRRAGTEANQPFPDISDAAELLSEQLQESGFLRPAASLGGGASIIGAMERTESGEELYEALGRSGVVSFFEGMHAEIDAGEVKRLLHQLDS